MNYSYDQLKVSESARHDDTDDLEERALNGKYLVDREDEQDTPSVNENEVTINTWLASQHYSSDVEDLDFN